MMKPTFRLLISVALAFGAGTLFASDFRAFEYRNIGPSRGGRVTAVAGTVAAPATFYLGASGGGVLHPASKINAPSGEAILPAPPPIISVPRRDAPNTRPCPRR